MVGELEAVSLNHQQLSTLLEVMQLTSVEDEILSFIKVLVTHPDQVQVNRIEGNPVIFEIRACKEDLSDLESKELAIQAIARSTGLRKGGFVLKFVG